MRFFSFGLLLFCFSFGIQSNICAQNEFRREVGLQLKGLNFNGFTPFEGFYKREIRENVYRRWSVGAGYIRASRQNELFDFFAGGSASLGREKRRKLDTHLWFFQGPNCSLNGSLGNRSLILGPAFGWIIGLQHDLNKHWSVNIETIPSVGLEIAYAIPNNRAIALFTGNFSTNAALSLVRRF
jgi:hypothetical protein